MNYNVNELSYLKQGDIFTCNQNFQKKRDQQSIFTINSINIELSTHDVVAGKDIQSFKTLNRMTIKLAGITDGYAETILLFQKGDKTAFGKLYDQFAPLIFSVILRIVEDRKDAETVLTRAFLQIWKNRKGYCPEKGCISIWLMHFAREAAFSFKGDRMIPAMPDFDWKQPTDDCAQKLLDMILIYGKTPEEVCSLLDMPQDILNAKLNQLFKNSHSKI
jgi:hypothetical protein